MEADEQTEIEDMKKVRTLVLIQNNETSGLMYPCYIRKKWLYYKELQDARGIYIDYISFIAP